MQLAGRLFGTETAKSAIFHGLKLMQYTEDEQKNYYKEWKQLYTPFKLLQRALAIAFCGIYIALHGACFSMRLFLYSSATAQSSLRVIQTDLNDAFGLIILAIVSFYFCGGMIEGGIKQYVNRPIKRKAL